uniref:F-box domain-containing protein n=1 Tax=Physcomitrium patens TaxID=3218 RepID=A0A7I4CB54_PHYPA
MGVATGLSTGCLPESFRTGKLCLGMIGNQKLNVEGYSLKIVEEEIDEVLSEWWGCRAAQIQKTGVEDKSPLIHSLPDDVMKLIFAQLPRQSLAKTRLVCSSWRRVAEDQDIASLRCKAILQMDVAEGWIYVLPDFPQGAPFRAYDPIAAKWSVLPPTPRRSESQQWVGFASVALGHKLLLIGGSRSKSDAASNIHSTSVVCSDVIIYDALTNKWRKGAKMNTPRSWFASSMIGGKVYVAGGQGNTRFLDSAEVYDPETDTWKVIASMAVQRSNCEGVALDGQFWVIAGEYVKNHYNNSQRSSAEVYDAETDTWRFVPNMYMDDKKVMEPSAVVNGELICVHQKRVMAYNKTLNSWSQLGHINGGEVYARSFSRFGFACESVGSNLYIIGGTREYSQNRHRYCSALNSVEVFWMPAISPSSYVPQRFVTYGFSLLVDKG